MLKLTINGQQRTFDGDPSTPLLWVLREHLDLTGTKFGCGVAACGACTVHLNGQPIRACVTPVQAAAGQRVTTIEGVGATRVGRTLQDAWVKHDVPQCGYCQSGQIMSAAALLASKKGPSDAEIVEAMNGNLCRCGTYQRIHAAVKDAAQTLSKSA
jgi:isoquinoline 1-oxidoreductase alpha subunit